MPATATLPPRTMKETRTKPQARDLEQEAKGPILVATDGTRVSDPALETARTLSRELGLPVQLVSVIEPTQTLIPAPDITTDLSQVDKERGEERLRAVRDQRERAGADEGWTIEIKFGDPPQMLARMAKARQASVVVMGRRAHGAVDRLLGDDTVFDVVRLADVPVLIATQPLPALPKVMTIAVEFSRLSASAARAALDLFPSAGLAYLVHVRPRVEAAMGVDTEQPETVEAGFTQLLKALGEAPRTRVDTVSLVGVPARELVDFAESSRSDLLVVGSYRRGLFRRLVGGGMAGRILRHAPCPVLVVPEAPPRKDTQVVELIKDQALAATLHEITVRNSGRKALLESDNVRVGAQALAFDYLFISADFDLEGEELRILLADDADRPVHRMVHLMRRPASIETTRAVDGSDHIVRIVDPAGEATVTFW